MKDPVNPRLKGNIVALLNNIQQTSRTIGEKRRALTVLKAIQEEMRHQLHLEKDAEKTHLQLRTGYQLVVGQSSQCNWNCKIYIENNLNGLEDNKPIMQDITLQNPTVVGGKFWTLSETTQEYLRRLEQLQAIVEQALVLIQTREEDLNQNPTRVMRMCQLESTLLRQESQFQKRKRCAETRRKPS